jgi:hypothetical protein
MQSLKESLTAQAVKTKVSSIESHESRIALQIAQEEERRQKRKEEKARKAETLEEGLELADPEIAELMGFGSFSAGAATKSKK